MSGSATEKRRRIAGTCLVYLLLTVFCALFGAVYESFSHGVFSYFMLYAFAFPLVLGGLPFFLMAFSRCPLPGRAALNLYHSGIAALTVGSIFQGVLEIYGTTNRLIAVYWAAGALLTAGGILLYLPALGKKPSSKAPGGLSSKKPEDLW